MSETLTQTLARKALTAAQLAQGDALPALDVSAAGIAKDAALTIAELVKGLSGYGAQANAAGNTTVTPLACALQHTEVLTFTGAAGTRIIVLDVANAPLPGSRLAVRCALPATAALVIEFRNATTGGTLLTTIETDGSGDDAVLEFYANDAGAWQFLRAAYPANA